MLESEYPDLDKCKLMGRDNVILNPHSGFLPDTSNYLVCTLPVQNAVAYVRGEPLPNGAAAQRRQPLICFDISPLLFSLSFLFLNLFLFCDRGSRAPIGARLFCL